MMDLRELYQEVILENNKHPRNQYAMKDATTQAEGYNPLCGDHIDVYLRLKDDVIQEVSFVGCGCAISQASASLMTDIVKGKKKEEALALFHRFHEMVTSSDAPEPKVLDKLTALAGVRHYPARVKCATLAWHTFESALNRDAKPVSTE